MKGNKKMVQTYIVTRKDGKEVKVTIPEDDNPMDVLIDALKDNFSPGAIATMASALHGIETNNGSVNMEVLYMRDVLIQILGMDEYNKFLNALGL